MTEPTGPVRDPGLNPALKSRREDTYDTGHRTPPPVETASVQREEGRGWPIVWLGVVVVCVPLAVHILIL